MEVIGVSISAPSQEIAKKEFEKSLIKNWLIIMVQGTGLVTPVKYYDAPILDINMPCGERKCYKTIFDVPSEDVVCTCGNPEHYFIKFEITE